MDDLVEIYNALKDEGIILKCITHVDGYWYIENFGDENSMSAWTCVIPGIARDLLTMQVIRWFNGKEVADELLDRTYRYLKEKNADCSDDS